MLTFRPHKKPVCGLAFSPDGRTVATAARGEPVRLWNLDDATEAKHFAVTASTVADPTIAFSPHGRFLALGGGLGLVWEVESGACVIEASRSSVVAFSPDGREVAAVPHLAVQRWSLPKGESLDGWGTPAAQNRGLWEPTGALAYSPDGKNIAVVCVGLGAEPNSILIRGRNTGKPRLEIVPDFGSARLPRAVAFSPDGARIAATDGPELGVIDIKTGARVAVLKPGRKHFTGFGFTPDGERLVAVNNDAAVHVYDTTTWAEAASYEWQIGKLTSVAVAPDGLRAACGSDQGRVVVWDLE